MPSARAYALPPRPCREDGAPRRLGVELEFIGPDLADVAAIVAC